MAANAKHPPFPRFAIVAERWIVTANHAGCDGQDGFPHYRIFAGDDEAAARDWARNTYEAAGMTVRVERLVAKAPLTFPRVRS